MTNIDQNDKHACDPVELKWAPSTPRRKTKAAKKKTPVKRKEPKGKGKGKEVEEEGDDEEKSGEDFEMGSMGTLGGWNYHGYGSGPGLPPGAGGATGLVF